MRFPPHPGTVIAVPRRWRWEGAGSPKYLRRYLGTVHCVVVAGVGPEAADWVSRFWWSVPRQSKNPPACCCQPGGFLRRPSPAPAATAYASTFICACTCTETSSTSITQARHRSETGSRHDTRRLIACLRDRNATIDPIFPGQSATPRPLAPRGGQSRPRWCLSGHPSMLSIALPSTKILSTS